MQKLFNFLINVIVRVIAGIITSSWYRESVRASGLSEKKFAWNAIISLGLLAAILLALAFAP